MNAAQLEAMRRVGYLNLPPKPERIDGLVVQIIEYDTDALAGFLTGVPSAEFQRCVANDVKRILERRHAVVHRRILTMADCVRQDEGVSTSALTFLRRLALAVQEQGRTSDRLIASQLYEIAEAAGVDVPGLREPDEYHGKLHVDVVLGCVFRAGNSVDVDGFTVTRDEVDEQREGGRTYTQKYYTFATTNSPQAHKTLNVQENTPIFSGSLQSCGRGRDLPLARSGESPLTAPEPPRHEKRRTISNDNPSSPGIFRAVAITLFQKVRHCFRWK